MDKQEVFQWLDENKITYEAVEHPPVYTMEEMEELGLHKQGNICKNLFLRDAKGKRHFLVILGKDKQADLKALRAQLGSTALSFGSEERLMKQLGLTKGAVSVFGILNNKEATVEVAIDRDFLHEKRMGCHPNDNTATVFLDFKDVKKMIQNNGNKLMYLTIK
ncbi:MAG: prolyl-tRNA synthetase associated domain-containing protein [Lachnospiraceae bacterium]|nr:prolyl-tRNA synthetase associated domain-containing protein [Lachnospiraceae bacterium]